MHLYRASSGEVAIRHCNVSDTNHHAGAPHRPSSGQYMPRLLHYRLASGLPSTWFYCALLFLLAPSTIVLAYFVPWPGLTLSLVVIAAALILKDSDLLKDRDKVRHAIKKGWPLFLVVACIVWHSGVLPPFTENGDWWKHHALLNILIGDSWPPEVVTPGGTGKLRYYLSYYVVPALFAKVGIPVQLTLYTITVIGCSLALLVAYGNHQTGSGRAAIFALGFLMFSGADLLGTAITGLNRGPPMHLEWWAGFAAMNSIVTHLFWAPQHAIAGLLAGLLIYRYPPLAVRHAGILLVATSLWSPFVALGMGPLLLWAITLTGWGRAVNSVNLVITPVILLAIFNFLMEGSAGLPIQFIWEANTFSLPRWLVFVLLEFALMILVLSVARPERLRILVFCAVWLMTLSLLKLGGTGDLLLRGSIPALAVIALIAAETLVLRPRGVAYVPLLLLFMAGLATPVGEIARAFKMNRIKEPSAVTLMQGVHNRRELLSHYLVERTLSKDPVTAGLEKTPGFEYSTFGSAEFDLEGLRVSSKDYTDAAFVTQSLTLAPGTYRVEVVLDWDVESEFTNKHGAHVSLHGRSILIPIATSEGKGGRYSSFFNSDGRPFQLSVGLGGWTKGKGYVVVKEMNIYALSEGE